MPESTTLLERNTAGVLVEINWLPVTRVTILRVVVGNQSALTEISPERVSDAFQHPFVYLDEYEVTRLLPKP